MYFKPKHLNLTKKDNIIHMAKFWVLKCLNRILKLTDTIFASAANGGYCYLDEINDMFTKLAARVAAVFPFVKRSDGTKVKMTLTSKTTLLA